MGQTPLCEIGGSFLSNGVKIKISQLPQNTVEYISLCFLIKIGKNQLISLFPLHVLFRRMSENQANFWNFMLMF